jgi:hypothetical protein
VQFGRRVALIGMSVWQYAQGFVVLSPASSGQMGWSEGNLQKETAKLWEFSWSHIPKSPALDRIGRTEKRKGQSKRLPSRLWLLRLGGKPSRLIVGFSNSLDNSSHVSNLR